MERLGADWLTNGLIDFEYKKYLLLSYMMHVQKEYSDKKLFPVLKDIQDCYDDLYNYKTLKKKIKNDFPKEVSSIDYSRFSLNYVEKVQDSEYLTEIDAIVDFAITKLDEKVTEGQEILDYIKEHIEVEPIGISPLKTDTGYIFLYYHNSSEVDIYTYRLSPVKGLKQHDDEIKTFFLSKSRISFVNSLENIKVSLLKTNRELANPAAFSVLAKVDIPYRETFLPVAKKLLINQLAA
jgi:hypothetical protein